MEGGERARSGSNCCQNGFQLQSSLSPQYPTGAYVACTTESPELAPHRHARGLFKPRKRRVQLPWRHAVIPQQLRNCLYPTCARYAQAQRRIIAYTTFPVGTGSFYPPIVNFVEEHFIPKVCSHVQYCSSSCSAYLTKVGFGEKPSFAVLVIDVQDVFVHPQEPLWEIQRSTDRAVARLTAVFEFSMSIHGQTE